MAERSSRSAAPRAPLYFVNAPCDVLCIGGLSILLFALLGGLQHGRPIPPSWYAVVAALTWLCNWPHFAATSYRLYHTRRNIAQYPITALAVPFVLLAATGLSFTWTDTIAPYFVKLFLIWSPYHYSGQSVGISLIYAKRAGVPIGWLERIGLAGFIFGTFVVTTARAEVGVIERTFYGIRYPTLGLPPIVANAAEVGMWVCGALFLIGMLRWGLRARRWLPPIVLLPAVTQFVWFVVGWRVPSFYEFVPFFHGLQYLLIAWAMQLKEQLDESGARPSPRFVWWETARWGVGILIGGAILFWVLPRVFAFGGYPQQIAEPIVITAVQIHHFFVDGVIWKLRNPAVGSPLLVNIEQLARGRASAAQPA